MVRRGDGGHIPVAGVPAVAGGWPGVAGPGVAGDAPSFAEVVASVRLVEVFETADSAEAALASFWQSRTASNKLLPRPECVR